MPAHFPDAGKVPAEFLQQFVYRRCGARRPEVAVGPEHGVDVAVVDLPNGYGMALTTDPCSLVPSLGLRKSAWLTVHLLASDITTTGCPPQYALFDLNLPPDLGEQDFEDWWEHVHGFCSELGVAVVGGHTARFHGQQSTIAGGGMMVAIAPRQDILTSKGGRPGDRLIVTRQCGLAATAILALSFPQYLRDRCGGAVVQEAQQLFFKTSTVNTALAAVTAGRGPAGVTAMHDATEGGVRGALTELAGASGCGLRVDRAAIPVRHAVREVCACFDLDPTAIVSAGVLIIAAAPERACAVREALTGAGIDSAVVGELTPPETGMVLVDGNAETPLRHPGEDAYWKAFYNAMQAGLQ